MEHINEPIPISLANALAKYLSHLPSGDSIFTSHDLLIGKGLVSSFQLETFKKQGKDVDRKFLFSMSDDGEIASIPLNTKLQGERIIEGPIVRAIVAVLEVQQLSENIEAFAEVGWRSTTDEVVISLVPRRSSEEGTVVGGSTSFGREIHYHLNRETLKVLRTTFAR